ncbi:MAG TPA: 3-hydroxyacyl-CoA dehydrogenase family protein [Thermoleophilia bacterium]|nr:3-hydroxyacyl-CoA dehydrogenase family protein [Thermoleophilia bacterium]
MKVEDVRKVAVFGAGTMGPGLAQVFATAGYHVALYSRKAETLQKALSVAKTNMATFVEHGLLTENAVADALGRIAPTQSVAEAATDADFVIESIAEKMDAKKALYDELDAVCPERTILTSNTSYLNIYEAMPANRLPQTVIAHWFAPPHVVPLVEVVKGEQTSRETVDFVVEFLQNVDRVPTVMEKFVSGFCINRFLRIIGREVFFLLDNGYMTADQLDLAVKASIIPRAMVLGFVQRYDFTGLDLSYNNLQNPDFVEAPIDNQPKSLREAVERGDLGVKTGKGFFDYRDRPLEQVLKARDAALIDVFKSTKDLIYKRI